MSGVCVMKRKVDFWLFISKILAQGDFTHKFSKIWSEKFSLPIWVAVGISWLKQGSAWEFSLILGCTITKVPVVVLCFVSLASSEFAIGHFLFDITVCVSLFAFVSQVGCGSVSIRPSSVAFLTQTFLHWRYLTRYIAVIQSVQEREQVEEAYKDSLYLSLVNTSACVNKKCS